MADTRERPLSIAILAVGGQGGGVLTNWLVDVAECNGYLAQSTFVAGVAQRTGSTVYCVEMFPKKRAEAIGRDPVFTPYPVPGDVDLVVAGEMAETGRAIQKGFVTPNITTLIASSHRIYSVLEKDALGDGIYDQEPVAQVAARASQKFVCFDMAAAAEETGSAISSVLLGAIAGAGALPFERKAFEDAIRDSGRAVEANLKGFVAGFEGGENRKRNAGSCQEPGAARRTPGTRLPGSEIRRRLPGSRQGNIRH
jgi:indolepyruvate ferredoxin oxidoreductase beta subunit